MISKYPKAKYRTTMNLFSMHKIKQLLSMNLDVDAHIYEQEEMPARSN